MWYTFKWCSRIHINLSEIRCWACGKKKFDLCLPKKIKCVLNVVASSTSQTPKFELNNKMRYIISHIRAVKHFIFIVYIVVFSLHVFTAYIIFIRFVWPFFFFARSSQNTQTLYLFGSDDSVLHFVCSPFVEIIIRLHYVLNHISR